MTSVTLGKEVFTDLDFADDISLLAVMLEVLVLALTVMQEEASTFGLQLNWSKTKILVPSSTSSSTVQVADGHVEVVDAFVYLGCLIDSSGGSRGEVLRRIGLARSCMNMLDRRIWKSRIRLETKLHLYQTYIVRVLMYRCETWATTKFLLSLHLTHGHYETSWGYRILAICQMWKSEEPLVVHRFLTWWLIDVCGSSAILLAVHLARTTIEPLQRVSDKYRLTGSDQQEDLATLGSMQLRLTLALWTLASWLLGERPLLEMNGNILWTQQCSSRVCSERRRMRKEIRRYAHFAKCLWPVILFLNTIFKPKWFGNWLPVMYEITHQLQLYQEFHAFLYNENRLEDQQTDDLYFITNNMCYFLSTAQVFSLFYLQIV